MIPYVYGATGHRPDRLGGYDSRTRERLVTFAEGILAPRVRLNLIDKMIVGMALGWDQAVAEACVRLGVPFIAALPFPGQEARWPVDSMIRYNELLSKAAEIVEVSPAPYAPWKMDKRNDWIVDHCNILIALYSGEPSGTMKCVSYANYRCEVVNYWNLWLLCGELVG